MHSHTYEGMYICELIIAIIFSYTYTYVARAYVRIYGYTARTYSTYVGTHSSYGTVVTQSSYVRVYVVSTSNYKYRYAETKHSNAS